MKEVMSAVWLRGLDANYLRDQVRGEAGGVVFRVKNVCCVSAVTAWCPVRPWGSR